MGSVRHEFLICNDQTGTASSSPLDNTASHVDMNIVNTMLWMQRNAYEPTTIKKVAKLLRHLQRNIDTTNPETVKLYIANKKCSNGHKENLIEAYAIVIRSLGLTWNQPFYQRYDKKRRAPKEEQLNFIINYCRMEMATKLSISKDLGQRPIELTWLTIKDIDLNRVLTQNLFELKTFIDYDLKLDRPERDAVFWKIVGDPIYRILEKGIVENCRNSEKYQKTLFEKIDALINELRPDKELLRERKERGKKP
jgi:hypothetical protein